MFGRNLTDKIYMINGYGEAPSFGYTATYSGPPREWGVSLNVRF
jgi:outer membrane receptor protein involved in Fe transport